MSFYGPKKNKFGAKKTEVAGIVFDSKTEADYYAVLLWEQKVGAIEILEMQPRVYLTASKILYKPDFKIFDTKAKVEIFIEIKGYETPVYKLKKRLWKDYGPGLLRVIKKVRGNFEVTEEIKRI